MVIKVVVIAIVLAVAFLTIRSGITVHIPFAFAEPSPSANESNSSNYPSSTTAGNIVNFDNWKYRGITSGTNWQYIGQIGAKAYTKGDCTYIVQIDHPDQNILRCIGHWPP